MKKWILLGGVILIASLVGLAITVSHWWPPVAAALGPVTDYLETERNFLAGLESAVGIALGIGGALVGIGLW